MTRTIRVGNLKLGGGNPVLVQSMTNTDTRDVPATLAQIRALADAGCDLVRVSVYDGACAEAVRDLVDGSPVPLVADIHFDYRLAIAAMENGIAKLRINPGNIGGEDRPFGSFYEENFSKFFILEKGIGIIFETFSDEYSVYLFNLSNLEANNLYDDIEQNFLEIIENIIIKIFNENIFNDNNKENDDVLPLH